MKQINPINSILNKIRKEGYTAVSDLSLTQLLFQDIIIPKGEKGAGVILTYRQAVIQHSRREAKYNIPHSPYTKVQYQREMEAFKKRYAGRLTVSGVKGYYREGAERLFKDLRLQTGIHVNISDLSDTELKSILDDATERMGKRVIGDSAELIENIVDIMRGKGQLFDGFDEPEWEDLNETDELPFFNT